MHHQHTIEHQLIRQAEKLVELRAFVLLAPHTRETIMAISDELNTLAEQATALAESAPDQIAALLAAKEASDDAAAEAPIKTIGDALTTIKGALAGNSTGGNSTGGNSTGGGQTTTSPVTLSPAELPDPSLGVAYSATVATTGGEVNETFTYGAGALPPGLALDATSGAITGTPTTAGTFPFTVTATGSAGSSGSQDYTATVS